MKVLHVVKTLDGAWWALEQVKILKNNHHLDIHVIVPTGQGKFLQQWKSLDVTLHQLDVDIPIKNPFLIFKRIKALKTILKKINPDIIHSHFFGTTITLRLANKAKIPMIFQVPGPLHLENFFFKYWEILSAKKHDYWIASSKYIRHLYHKENINPQRVFLSYYGSDYKAFNQAKKDSLRKEHLFSEEDFLVGNVSYIYAPKKYLFQKRGLKNHELLIESIAKAQQKNSNIKGLLIGGQWGNSLDYENKLRQYANKLSKNNIVLTGKVSPEKAHEAWQNLDLCLHLPTSENCGGVIEPLLSGLPVLTNNTGGIPEVIIDGVTGYITSNNPKEIAEKIEKIRKNNNHENIVRNGQALVKTMFDVKRTACEVFQIYQHIINQKQKPQEFDSIKFCQEFTNEI